jgi:hypothetical protein
MTSGGVTYLGIVVGSRVPPVSGWDWTNPGRERMRATPHAGRDMDRETLCFMSLTPPFGWVMFMAVPVASRIASVHLLSPGMIAKGRRTVSG